MIVTGKGLVVHLPSDNIAELACLAIPRIEHGLSLQHYLLLLAHPSHQRVQLLLQPHRVQCRRKPSGHIKAGSQGRVGEADHLQSLVKAATDCCKRDAEVRREEATIVVLVRSVHFRLREADVAVVEGSVERHKCQLPTLDSRALVSGLVLQSRAAKRDVSVASDHARLIVDIDEEHTHDDVVVQQDWVDCDFEVEVTREAASALQRAERLARVIHDDTLLLDDDAEIAPALRHAGQRDLGQEQRGSFEDVDAIVDHALQILEAPLLARRVHSLHRPVFARVPSRGPRSPACEKMHRLVRRLAATGPQHKRCAKGPRPPFSTCNAPRSAL
eukprot:2889028-Rhodomonas_salina.4